MTISAKVIADSITASGHRITTFELEYPRFCHAEFMTHRVFSRNAASSRAIPVSKSIELIKANVARPVHWGKNQPGMSAREECFEDVVIDGCVFSREAAWDHACVAAIEIAAAFNKAGYHKQVVNRLLEPFTHIKVVLTTTETDNWFWLRRHPDADPTIQVLAEEIWQASQGSKPVTLKPGEWHLPYFGEGYWKWKPSGYVKISQFDVDDKYGGYTLEEAIAISASCCAQVSYRKNDDSLEKAKAVYQRLVESSPVHASPFEHQATPMPSFNPQSHYGWPEGVTHLDRNGDCWSGNFRGWIQHRQLIPNNVCNHYEG